MTVLRRVHQNCIRSDERSGAGTHGHPNPIVKHTSPRLPASFPVMESSSANTLPSSKRLLGLLVFFVISYAIAAIGGLSTTSSVNGWYAEIQKPVWTPPNVVFGPVWTFLYSLIAWVGWRFWLSAPSANRRRTLQLFGLQWILNALWSPVFFGAQAYVAGAVIILGLVVAISMLIAQGRKIDALAAWALTPYLLWVSYASTLNIGIWYLNR